MHLFENRRNWAEILPPEADCEQYEAVRPLLNPRPVATLVLAAALVSVTLVTLTQAQTFELGSPPDAEALADRKNVLAALPNAEGWAGPALEHAERALAQVSVSQNEAESLRARAIAEAALTLADRQILREEERRAASAAEARVERAEEHIRQMQALLERWRERSERTE